MSRALHAMGVALLIALACALTSGSALATTMILEPAGEFRMISNGPVTYSGEGIEFSCRMTIAGEFERSIASIETEGATLGQIREEAWSECREVETPILALRLPWLIRTVRILGTLPRSVTGILYAIATDTISFRIFGVLCLYVGAIGMLWPFSFGLVRDLGTSYTRFSGGFPCPSRLIRSGEFSISPTQTASFR